MSTRSKSGRIVRQTDKGRSFNAIQQEERANNKKNLMQLIHETEEVIDSYKPPSNLSASDVRYKSTQTNLMYEKFLSVQTKCMDLSLPEDRITEADYMEKVSQDVRMHQARCDDWLRDYQTNAASTAIETASRKSRRSFRSNSSRASSRMSEKLAEERVINLQN